MVLEGLRLAVIAVLVGRLAVWLGPILRQEFATGVARARGRVYRKRRNPALFWLTLVGQVVILMGCLYVLTRLVPRLFM